MKSVRIDVVAPRPKKFPCYSVFVYLYHKMGSIVDIDGQKYRTLSSQLVTEGEIDYAVNRLIKDLEITRREAKKTLARLRKLEDQARKQGREERGVSDQGEESSRE